MPELSDEIPASDYVVTDRFIERMENFVMRLGSIARELNDARLMEIHHGLWMQSRILKRDEDLSAEDIQ